MVESAFIGIWAYLFCCKLVQPQELLSRWGRFVNVAISGHEGFADPSTLSGWKLFLYKYTYCPVCLAGLLSLGYSITTNWEDFFFHGAIAMITAQILETYARR